METSSLIFTLTSLLALTTASPAARPLIAREAPYIDLLIQSSPISSSNLNAHAIQVVLGEIKVCIGDDGFAPCSLSQLNISPWGANTDITAVECQGFSDTEATVPVTGVFTVEENVVLSDVGTVEVGSFICSCL